MNIWLVNPFDPLPGESFRPGRYAFLAHLLADKGHKVSWWTSNFFHMTKSYRKPPETKPGLRIIQLGTPRYKRNIGLKRLLNHSVYAGKFNRRAKEENPPDLIISSCPPLSSAAAAIKIARELGIKCVVDIQDLWPESFDVVFPPSITRTIFYPFRKYADGIYRSADALTAVSRTYLDRAASVRKNGTKSIVSYLGIDVDLFDACGGNDYHPGKTEGALWAVYIGTIGRCYDIKTILDAAQLLKSLHPRIKFLIAGDGPQYAMFHKMAKRKNLSNCQFLGLLAYARLVGLLRQSDIGLNTFVANAKNSFPNKVFDYMAAGLALVNSIEGELEGLIRDRNIGLQYRAGDPHSLSETVLELHRNPHRCGAMGENARRLVEQRFDRNKEYPKYEQFISEVAGVAEVH